MLLLKRYKRKVLLIRKATLIENKDVVDYFEYRFQGNGI